MHAAHTDQSMKTEKKERYGAREKENKKEIHCVRVLMTCQRGVQRAERAHRGSPARRDAAR